MPHRPAPNSSQDAVLLEAAADQAIAACGGDMREAIKALIVANDFLETEVAELMCAVSQAYAHGRFKPYNG
jgi:stage V sporulation protein SpoVS